MNFPKPENVLRKALGSSRIPLVLAFLSIRALFSPPCTLIAHFSAFPPASSRPFSPPTDLIAVGKEDVALETLHTVLIPRKHRTWSDIYEQVCASSIIHQSSSSPTLSLHLMTKLIKNNILGHLLTHTPD